MGEVPSYRFVASFTRDVHVSCDADLKWHPIPVTFPGMQAAPAHYWRAALEMALDMVTDETGPLVCLEIEVKRAT